VKGSNTWLVNSEKSPARIFSVGTVKVVGSGCTRRCSNDPMKNVLP
jgi:hypothetical protein